MDEYAPEEQSGDRETTGSSTGTGSGVRNGRRFRVLGLLHKGKTADEEEIRNSASSPEYYRKKWYFRTLAILIPTANAVCIGLAIAGIISFTTWGIVFASIGLFSSSFSKGISRMQSVYGKKMLILTTLCTDSFIIVEEKKMRCSALKEIKELVGGEKQTASQAVKRLQLNCMNALDQRNNMLMQFVLNGLFFWELRQVMKIEAWKEKLCSPPAGLA